jgi:hypothetical protein
MADVKVNWIEPLAKCFSLVVSRFFDSHSSVRCESQNSSSGHDFIRGSMALFTKDGNVVIHSICRYCGATKQQVIENIMLNPNFSNAPNSYSEREM